MSHSLTYANKPTLKSFNWLQKIVIIFIIVPPLGEAIILIIFLSLGLWLHILPFLWHPRLSWRILRPVGQSTRWFQVGALRRSDRAKTSVAFYRRRCHRKQRHFADEIIDRTVCRLFGQSIYTWPDDMFRSAPNNGTIGANNWSP
jgi:hypothetical protein